MTAITLTILRPHRRSLSGATSSWSVPVTIMNATHAVCTSPPSRRCTATPEDEGRSSEVSASSTSSHMSAHPASFQSTFDAVSFCLSLNGHDCVGPPPAATRFFTYAVTGPLPWQVCAAETVLMDASGVGWLPSAAGDGPSWPQTACDSPNAPPG